MKIQMDRQSAQTIEIACRAQLEYLRDENAKCPGIIDISDVQPTSHLANLLELYNRANNTLLGNHADYDVMRVPYWMGASHAR